MAIINATNANVATIDQDNYSINGKLVHRWSAGETSLKVGYAYFDEDRFETEYEVEFDRALPRFTGDQTLTGITDKELSVRLEHEIALGEGAKLLVGGLWQDKDRATAITEAPRDRYNLTAANRQGYDQFARNPTEFVRPFGAFIPAVGGINMIGNHPDLRQQFNAARARRGQDQPRNRKVRTRHARPYLKR